MGKSGQRFGRECDRIGVSPSGMISLGEKKILKQRFGCGLTPGERRDCGCYRVEFWAAWCGG